jgi:hypothetical protein
MKTAELTGAALNWAVAKCKNAFFGTGVHAVAHFIRNQNMFCYATDWSEGGPIIERERIQIRPERGVDWRAFSGLLSADASGPTPLIAAMRCYVASKLGDEIEIPEELL